MPPIPPPGAEVASTLLAVEVLAVVSLLGRPLPLSCCSALSLSLLHSLIFSSIDWSTSMAMEICGNKLAAAAAKE
jgi:hypothetical protein